MNKDRVATKARIKAKLEQPTCPGACRRMSARQFRAAPALRYVHDPALLGNAALLQFCCEMNVANWEFVPESMRSDKIFDAMLASPWNAAHVAPEPIPPLVLQLGAPQDRDDDARVLAAVRHSGYNLCFASARARASPAVVAWAAAATEVKAITDADARTMHQLHEHILHRQLPAHSTPRAWEQQCAQDARRWQLDCKHADARGETTGCASIGFVDKHKVGVFFGIPTAVRRMLWPGYNAGTTSPAGEIRRIWDTSTESAAGEIRRM